MKPIKHSPNGAKFVDQSVIDNFHAYLTQKGYKFTPGANSGCDVSLTLEAAQTAQHTRVHGGSGSCGFCGFQDCGDGVEGRVSWLGWPIWLCIGRAMWRDLVREQGSIVCR